MKCATSLWSADLANLGAEIRRVDPFSERFHIDVADGHYVRNLLFFPDQVKALRPYTRKPFEVHLMTVLPEQWVEPFVDAGADIFIFCYDTLRSAVDLVKVVKAAGKMVGISIQIEEPVEILEPFIKELDLVTVMGTKVGIKGASMDPLVPAKVKQLKEMIRKHQSRAEVQADGGIRRETVPLLHSAGVDWIVPGSLMFREDPESMRTWLANL